MLKCSNTKIGFTLIEIITVVGAFSIIIGSIAGLFISGISAQRRIQATQELLDQTSYVLEYMGRALRMARKELNSPPVCLSGVGGGRGYNYQRLTTADHGREGIRFIDYNGNCTEFFLEAGRLRMRVGGEVRDLTSPALRVNQFRINLRGESQNDDIQPRVTIFLEILGRGEKDQPRIRVQTSISQRNLDVVY